MHRTLPIELWLGGHTLGRTLKDARRYHREGRHDQALEVILDLLVQERYRYKRRFLARWQGKLLDLIAHQTRVDLERLSQAVDETCLDRLRARTALLAMTDAARPTTAWDRARAQDVLALIDRHLPLLMRRLWEVSSVRGEAGDFLAGRRLLGRFAVRRRLGHGPTGSTYLCTDLDAGREVVVKAVFDADNESIQRELRLHQMLASNGWAPSLLEDDPCQGNDFFIIMEYVSGGSLAERLAAGWRPDCLVETMIQVCRALEAVHAEGIVHRDLKPQNILLTADGRVLITDFGIAHRIGAVAPPPVAGSRDYVAPEVLAGEAGDPRSDVYAAGRVLHLLVRVSEAAPGADAVLARGLEAVIARATAESPDGRYDSMAVLRQSLEGFRRSDTRLPGMRFISPQAVTVQGVTVRLSGFDIDSEPIRREQFNAFVAAGAYRIEDGPLDPALLRRIWTAAGHLWLIAGNLPRRPMDDEALAREGHRPMREVAWFEAAAFCNWRTVTWLAPELLTGRLTREGAARLEQVLFYGDAADGCGIGAAGAFRLPTQFELAAFYNAGAAGFGAPVDFYELAHCSFMEWPLLVRYEGRPDPLPGDPHLPERLVLGRQGAVRAGLRPDVAQSYYRQGFRTVQRRGIAMPR